MSPSLLEPGKPHIFLLEDAACEKEHYARSASTSQAREELVELIDSLYEVVQTKAMSARCLHAIQAGINSRFKVVYEVACRRLVQLSHYFPDAQALLCNLAKSTKASIRLRIIQAIWTDRPPLEITKELLRNGLRDKSGVVRSFASDRILLHDLRGLASDLAEAIKNERKPEIRRGMTHSLDLLRDGYYLEPTATPDQLSLAIRTHHSIVIRGLRSQECTPENIRRIVREVQTCDEKARARARHDT